jgi:hypothetical protein
MSFGWILAGVLSVEAAVLGLCAAVYGRLAR